MRVRYKFTDNKVRASFIRSAIGLAYDRYIIERASEVDFIIADIAPATRRALDRRAVNLDGTSEVIEAKSGFKNVAEYPSGHSFSHLLSTRPILRSTEVSRMSATVIANVSAKGLDLHEVPLSKLRGYTSSAGRMYCTIKSGKVFIIHLTSKV